jgi:hypothetical protein
MCVQLTSNGLAVGEWDGLLGQRLSIHQMINVIASNTVLPIDNQNNIGHSVDKMQGLKSIWQMLLEWAAKPNYCGSRLHNSGLHGLHTVSGKKDVQGLVPYTNKEEIYPPNDWEVCCIMWQLHGLKATELMLAFLHVLPCLYTQEHTRVKWKSRECRHILSSLRFGRKNVNQEHNVR